MGSGTPGIHMALCLGPYLLKCASIYSRVLLFTLVCFLFKILVMENWDPSIINATVCVTTLHEQEAGLCVCGKLAAASLLTLHTGTISGETCHIDCISGDDDYRRLRGGDQIDFRSGVLPWQRAWCRDHRIYPNYQNGTSAGLIRSFLTSWARQR